MGRTQSQKFRERRWQQRERMGHHQQQYRPYHWLYPRHRLEPREARLRSTIRRQQRESLEASWLLTVSKIKWNIWHRRRQREIERLLPTQTCSLFYHIFIFTRNERHDCRCCGACGIAVGSSTMSGLAKLLGSGWDPWNANQQQDARSFPLGGVDYIHTYPGRPRYTVFLASPVGWRTSWILEDDFS